ncbi:macrolide ABC transporter permease [Clostridium tetani]|uniref:ABC transporter permease n=1 Tax=Clostridium tetani TaxID=1513 RepID=UPI000512AE29|nr:ABC transporter permease [Clostridium tetani]KGI37495.1 macrolide ABC transporter permease [Clostridium tetani ATCC 9441]RXI47734.1 macrolide ABC transporter permease [Clostridium tetani]RXM60112.1 macrolide ABC transporter permease [Clostridium tetani]RXM66356.1 macrolide ABC transporter permease [Clostridium tetani]SUY65516.1 ABC transporter permease protein [Clostridium tetani]
MNILEGFQSALQSVKSNKLRSFLTMLGIIIGISSVITIVSIGDGAKQFITGEFENIGTNLINMKMSSSPDITIEKRDYFTMDDVKLLKNKISEIEYASPELGLFGKAKVENKMKQASIMATNEDSKKFYNLKMMHGRYLNEHDLDSRRAVATIDDRTAKHLFNRVDVVGEKIKFNIGDKNIDLSIIGVFKDPRGNMGDAFGGSNMPGFLTMPLTIVDRLTEDTDIRGVSVMLSDMKNADQVSNKMIRLIENKHKNRNKYTAEKGFKELESINKVLGVITMVLGAIAAISLLVGGIGVMNIMLVSVTERTREIGIRKAIGAKTRDIRVQFLMESIILCLIGGSVGTILGILVGKFAGSLINIQIVVSLKVILTAFGFSSAVGIFFGLYPANQAAQLNPIDALRYE